MFLNNRHYDPTTGIFISVDPLVTMTGEPYIYGSANPVTYSDPSGLCAGSEVFDYCITDDGKVLDQGTTRLTPATNLGGADSKQVANFIDQMQTGDPSIGDSGYLNGIYGMEYALATSMFNQALSNGTIFMDDSGSYSYFANRGDPLWMHSIAEMILGVEGGTMDTAIALAAVQFGAGAWPGAGSVPGGACSFSGETHVLMADGSTRPISEVAVGDWVLALDPETGERGARQVTRLWLHDDFLIDLIVDGNAITTTSDHPFWSESDQAWLEAVDLDDGDSLLTAEGAVLRAEGFDWSSAHYGAAYNLTVEGVHTYFVVAGDDEVLVHNECGKVYKTRPLPSRQDPIAATNGQQRALAKYLGYRQVRGEFSQGQPVFTNGKNFITHDNGAHNGGFWKIGPSVRSLGSKSTREATVDMLLGRIGA